MDTISKDKGRIWDSLQFKFGLSYILIIAGVLLLLNTYPLRVSQDLVFRSKATTLQSSVSVMVYSLSGLDRLTEENVSQAMAVVEETGLSRILVTDSAGKVLYDTRETNDALGEYSFYTEIVQALLGNDVFSSSYRDGAFRSRAASPVLYQNQIIGAVYAYEYDTEQAALLEGLQGNLLRLSAGIAVVVLCLSGLLSRALTRKIGQLLTAIREVREGAYSHRAEVPGRDEIAQLAQEFNSLTDRLQTTENARRRFVSDASHELKTPLAAIRLLTDSILPDGEHRPGDGPGICHRHRAGGGAPLPYHRGSAPPDPAGQQRAGAAGGSGRAAGAGAGDADDEPGGPGEGNGTDLSGGGDLYDAGHPG